VKLKEGCEELNIPFKHKSVKDVTIDSVIDELLKNFDTYYDDLNTNLRK